ncbi:MAG: anti-sigma factor family protein [Actinomycetota bacterium]
MNTNLTHERCSELLRPYVQGELADDDRAAVAGHLESCADCRKELAGLNALLDYPHEGLTGTEVVRLDRGIAAVMGADRRRAATIIPLPPRKESRSGMAGVVFGAAAALLVVAVAIGSLMTAGTDEGDDSGGEAAVTGEDAGGGAAPEGPRPVFGGEHQRAFAAQDQAEPEASRNAKSLSRLAESDLARLGGSALFGQFADSYDTEDAAVLQDRFVAVLARGAGDDAGTVTLCTRNVLEASTGPALPVAGRFGRFEGESALVLGFVYTDQPEGALDRYSIWVFARGTCDTPLSTAAGNVR